MKLTSLLVIVGLLVVGFFPLPAPSTGPRVGSKKFTESVILGELATLLARDGGQDAVHVRELGGTRILFEALRAGEIDAYVEYTGTITREILNLKRDVESDARMELRRGGIVMSRPLGFNNSYAVAMLEEAADRLGIRTISDLGRHPDLVLGFGNEFLDRSDGWPSLKRAYGLPQVQILGMDHDVAYRQLENGAIHAMDVYTTDADIRYYGLRVLEDDRQHFPRYDAVLLYREDLVTRAPRMVDSLLRLEGSLDQGSITRLNARARLKRVPEQQVAGDFLRERLGISVAVEKESLWSRLRRNTVAHLELVRFSLVLAIFAGVLLGILAYKVPRAGQGILALVSIIQTIPALALLVVLIRPTAELGFVGVGTGSAAAIAALFLYSLLPIVRNTYEGLRGFAPDLRESAEALGLTSFARLRLVELPLASRSILAGIKTASILNVGLATLGALIGAGGFGQPILTGIRLDDYDLILEGAIPAAGLALLMQALFELAEPLVIPKGLRL